MGLDDGVSGEANQCGHPIQDGGLCRRSPMGGSDLCHQHGDLEPTEAERRASRENPIEHGYFVAGFLDEEEEQLFRAVVEGELEPSAIQRQSVAALFVRAMRMLEWEARGEDVSGLTTSVFAELRKTMDAMEPAELRVESEVSQAEISQVVTKLFREDRDLLLQAVPPEVRDDVAAVMV